MENIEKILTGMKEIKDEVVKTREELRVHVAETKDDRKKIEKHERVLFGSNGRPSLIAKVDKNLADIADIKRITWTIATPILIAIGVGIIFMIAQGGGYGGQ